jgi:hypothetical protein
VGVPSGTTPIILGQRYDGDIKKREEIHNENQTINSDKLLHRSGIDCITSTWRDAQKV